MRHDFENYVWNIGNRKTTDSMKQSVSKLLVPSLENLKLKIKYLNISVEKAGSNSSGSIDWEIFKSYEY